MNEARPTPRWVMGTGALIVLVMLFPLWQDLRKPGETLWNVVLTLLLLGIAVAAFFIQRYLQAHIGEVGEARFDTRNDRHD